MTNTMSGAELKKVRRDLGFSQDDLARELGVSRPTVSAWEKLEYVDRIVFLAINAVLKLPNLRRGQGFDSYGGETQCSPPK